MKICVISANLGGIDGVKPPNRVEQVLPDGWHADWKHHDHTNTTLRRGSLHPRMQAKIYRMYGWQIHPGYDYYIWLDAGFDVVSMDTITWFVNHCNDHDIVMFPHSQRKTIKAETDMVLQEIQKGNKYLIDRYSFEPLNEQLHEYLYNEKHEDNYLVETGAFCYRPTTKSITMLKDWFLECCRWTCQDQISLPVVARRHEVDLAFFETNIFNNGRIVHTGHNRR